VDSSQIFCLKDGTKLVDDVPSGFDSQPDTLILPSQLLATESLDNTAATSQGTPSTASVKLLGTKREIVMIDIVITRTGDRHTFNVALDRLVRYTIEEIIETLALPRRMPDGELIIYRLYSKTASIKYDDNLTFRQNGLSNGDTLSLHVESIAG
jgi:hypothetical protein